MKLRSILACGVAALITVGAGLGAGSATAAPTPMPAAAPTATAPTLSPARFIEGTVESVAVSGSCPVPAAGDASKNAAQVSVLDETDEVLWQSDLLPLNATGGYRTELWADYLWPGTFTVSVNCQTYDTQSTQTATLTVTPAATESIELVDNNGGVLLTGDPVTVVNTIRAVAALEAPQFIDVYWPEDELRFDPNIPPKVQLRGPDGAFIDLVYETRFVPELSTFTVWIESDIPEGGVVTVEVPAVVTAPAGGSVTVYSSDADGRVISKSYRGGESGAPKLVVTPTEGAAGINVKIDATGLQPNTTYDVEFHSKPTHVGQVTSDANGEVHTSITIPADAATGQHVIALFLDGEVVVAAPFRVTTPVPPTTTPGTTPTPTGSGPSATATASTSTSTSPSTREVAGTATSTVTSAVIVWPPSTSVRNVAGEHPLANTGAGSVGPLAGAGAALLVLGGALLLLTRRRDADHQH
ncbi:hypothetical protein [Nakamurella aerolata]|uniref:Gram-positive cocci surface proteins LPxTG domain-containing protein n=1 Tax=Nakamurella aerolata TaxID=1656892 RepID=A0A849AFA4_9ACTN|nr:hypothetical protein [Nakamurella aerolata]NNG37150.1 hypothetical protein [Nakamurella aerolata]